MRRRHSQERREPGPRSASSGRQQSGPVPGRTAPFHPLPSGKCGLTASSQASRPQSPASPTTRRPRPRCPCPGPWAAGPSRLHVPAEPRATGWPGLAMPRPWTLTPGSDPGCCPQRDALDLSPDWSPLLRLQGQSGARQGQDRRRVNRAPPARPTSHSSRQRCPPHPHRLGASWHQSPGSGPAACGLGVAGGH